MKSILYVTTVPMEYGGREDGGVATHSIQLMSKAKESYRIGLYADINKLKNINGITLYNEDKKLLKVFKGLLGFILVNKKKLKNLGFLGFKDKLKVLYHFVKLRKIVSNYDVIHIHSLHNDALTALSLLNYKQKLVVTDHGFWQGNIEKRIEKVRYNSFVADKVIYISDYAKTKHEEFSLNTNNLVKIYNPYLPQEITTINKDKIKEKLNIGNDSQVIFFSGVSDPVNRKGLDILLDSISTDKYLRENVYVIIVANEEGLKFAKNYKSINNIITLKPMHYSKVIELYNISDVFILPSRSESFGLVYIEALSYGTPVIGLDKVVSEFQNLYSPLYIGEAFNPVNEDSKVLTEKIKKVLSADIDKVNLRKETIKLFSWDKLFEEFIKVYEDIND